MIVQVWFPHAVDAIHKDLTAWVLEKRALGNPTDELWAIHKSSEQIKDALLHYTVGIARNKFGDAILSKLGDNISQVHIHFILCIYLSGTREPACQP